MQRPHVIAQQWLNAITSRDKVSLFAISDDAIEIHGPSGVGVGHSILADWFDTMPMRIFIKSLAECDSEVLVYHHIDWLNADNEIESSIDNAAIIGTREGKVCAYRRVADPDGLASKFTSVSKPN